MRVSFAQDTGIIKEFTNKNKYEFDRIKSLYTTSVQ